MMSKKLASLHILIEQRDYDILYAFSPNHGDLSKMARAIIHKFCDTMREGKTFELPPEIAGQIHDRDLKKKEDDDES
jgi:hypothetical protein